MDRQNNWSWNWFALIKQVVRYSRYCLNHCGIGIGVFTTLVQGIKNAQGWKHGEDLVPVTGHFSDWIVDQIQLQKLSESFQSVQMLQFLNLVGSHHQGLDVAGGL